MKNSLGRDVEAKIIPMDDIKISVNFINELKSVLKQIELRIEKNEEESHKELNHLEKEKEQHKLNDETKPIETTNAI